jgi:putative oxidoreductase
MAVQRGRYSEVLFALMRVFVGLLFATHGAQKLFGFPGAHPMPLKPLTLAAGIIEFGCGLLVALGLLTRIAAFVASGEMAVAYFMVHAKGGFWPIINKGELIAVGIMDELRKLGHTEQSSLEDIFLSLTGGGEEAELAEILK